MRVSLITVCYNSSSTIRSTIESVKSQDYPDLEYIIIDGKSNDGTLEIIKSYEGVVSNWISEPDMGLYDAMNKGINLATGDIVGVINSDDFYHRSDSISQVVKAFDKSQADAIYADIRFVNPINLDKTIRYYSSKRFSLNSFKYGVMPAHPTFFTYRKYFELYGGYNTSYKISADFELLIRFLYRYKISYYYLPIDLMKMRTGGISTKSWRSNVIINQEDLRACKENGLKTNYFWLYSRYFRKIFEFLPSLF